MTKKKSTKRALLLSGLSLLLCISMFVGSTFAWFTDSVTSTGNKIQAGTLKIDLELLDKVNGWTSLKESQAPLFDYDLWEPGYTDVKILKIENEGSLALKWMAKFVSDSEISKLAEVIDVYVCPSATELAYPAGRDLDGYTKVGTVEDFVNTIEETTKGNLAAEEVAYLGIALKMREVAGNEYQGLSLGAFDIQIVATQDTVESDSFDENYDAEASLNFAPVSNANELRVALANKEENIVLTNNIIIDDTYIVDYNANINGAGYALYRTSDASTLTLRNTPVVYTGNAFTVKEGTTLTLENVVVDGGAVWTGEVNPHLLRGTVNEGVTATGALVVTEKNATIILGEGAVLQNNDGANAVNLGTRTGGKLIVNGGEIINNHSAAGAIWGGGEIVLNSGKINYNHGGIGGAIRVVTNIGTILTMNGGEMNHN
ncbi:MAG: SipW-dependent-type signal peptide-containing protein, partial [Clostridia bacterium]|nr:SipW-dependent-type signal peptide-containing protein [Clostridia bacterium]